MTLAAGTENPADRAAETAAVLVVIPCLNEAAHLDTLLSRLVACRGVADQRIVVADGGSQDASRAIVQRWAGQTHEIHLLDNPRRLQSAGVNAAVAAYGDDREYLVRIDAHSVYPEAYVARLVGEARLRAVDSVVVAMRTVGDGCFQIAAATAQNSAIGTGGAAHRKSGLSGLVDHGHHALMRLGSFRRLHGYDPRFSHNEDAEYDHRLIRSGGRIWLTADLTIGYFPRATPIALFKQYMNYGRGRCRTLRLHRSRLRPRQALPLLILPAILAAGVAVLAAPLWSPAGLLALPVLVWLSLCLGASAVAGHRRGPCGWITGLAAALMHFGWSLGFWSERLFSPRLSPRELDPAI